MRLPHATLLASRLASKLLSPLTSTSTQADNSILLSSGTIFRRLACMSPHSSISANRLSSWWPSTTEHPMSLSSLVSSVTLWRKLELKPDTTLAVNTSVLVTSRTSSLTCGITHHSTDFWPLPSLISPTAIGEALVSTGASSFSVLSTSRHPTLRPVDQLSERALFPSRSLKSFERAKLKNLKFIIRVLLWKLKDLALFSHKSFSVLFSIFKTHNSYYFKLKFIHTRQITLYKTLKYN